VDDFNGRVAVVTGAAGGIGLAMAQRFARAGMMLVLADIEEPELEAAATAVGSSGGDVLAVPTDVTSQEQVGALAAAALDRFGRVDVVCNNAGVGPLGGVTEMSLEDYRWIVDVNFWGVLHGVRAFLPHLVERDDGHIVNTASVAGLLTQPGASAYNVSKFAVVALSESLYYELRLTGSQVGVSVVCPATIRTRIFSSERNRPAGIAPPEGPITERAQRAMTALAAASHRGPDEVAEKVLAAIRDDRFYVLTHPGILPFVRRRHEDIEAQRNPSVEQGF
jgi:NAD(P)-dependent dehydrogenase (short-subunit alcohol dehydrogenase family)